MTMTFGSSLSFHHFTPNLLLLSLPCQVGVTAAIGVDLVLEGALDDMPGIATPVDKSVYVPALKRLAAEGFVFQERRSPDL